MAGRGLQDAFIDDSDETCPLCVEEFDLSDKNFRPCPCGYQICQFCYNNVKNNMNGLCPACRRPYDDQSIEWKIVSPEEQKADIALQARKKAMARKKENEQRQVETLNRKNLAGIRVVQKNLVYVVGLSQQSSEEEFLRTLRGPQYFGQYGKITKIVVSKAKEGQNGSNSIGVYVTFENREDAARCIAAVDGSQNLDRPLRAQYGTTKYCSAFLRNETCGNRNCTFLHETGEDNDSFSRQDLSSMNALSTQQKPAHQASSSRSMQPPQPQPPPQKAPQNISAAPQAASTQAVRDDDMSRSDSGDGSALPSSASWAAKNPQNDSRRSSKPASVAGPSPVITNASVSQQPTETRTAPIVPETTAQALDTTSLPSATSPRQSSPEPPHPLEAAFRTLKDSSFEYTFDRSLYSEEELRLIESYPPLFDDAGGLKRFRMAKEKERDRQKEEEERNTQGAMSAVEEDEAPASGSLQLGGEPETQDEPNDNTGRLSAQQRGAIQPPFASSQFPFGGSTFQTQNGPSLTRTITPQQQQQFSLLRSQSSRQSPINANQFQQGYTGNTSLHHHQQSNPFQLQNPNQLFSSAQGHTRHASRYTFANDSPSASTAVKPAANPQLMAQQSAMMPSSQTKGFQNQQLHQSNIHGNTFYSGVHGPPPGLKSSGTPPISGGGMFGQGHGFASAMGGSAGFSSNMGSKNSNDDLMRDLLRNRNGSINGQGSDAGKREFKFPFAQQPMTSDAPASSLLSSLYGSQLGAHHGYQDHNLQKQKKKGKKHRHANTSSSGGGGLVDLADPSILQARMHHGAAGQGQFGAQGQDTIKQSSHVPTTESSHHDNNSPTLPEFTSIRSIANPGRVSTATPPGLSLPQDFPPLAAPSVQPAAPALPRLQRKVTTVSSAIKPVVPNIPTPSSKVSTALKDLQSNEPALDEYPVLPVATSTSESRVKSEALQVDAQNETPVVKANLVTVPVNVSQNVASSALAKAVDKKQRPGKLDIVAAKDGVKSGTELVDAPSEINKATSEVAGASISSQPPTPGTAVSQASASSAVRPAQSRTITLSRSEIQPASPSISTSATTSKQASRRPSMTSMHRPGTPLDERISDNASFTSTSISRANSPPGRVGSAPVRKMTKSQQKKERQARAKIAEGAAKAEEPAPKAEEVQAPILGRKKKAKKDKIAGTAESTPTVTRPTSPSPREEAMEEKVEVSATPATPVKENTKGSSRIDKETNTPSSPATPATGDQQKASLTPASLFAQLLKDGEIMASAAELFKTFSGINHRAEPLEPDSACIDQSMLSEEESRQLDCGDAVVLRKAPTDHVVVLPDRKILLGFTAEQASRYVELRKQALLNGDVPSPRALDTRHLAQAGAALATLAPAPGDAASATAANNKLTTSKSKKLVNQFATPTIAGPTTTNHPSNGHSKSGTVGLSADMINESLRNTSFPLSVEEAEHALSVKRKETEALEKRLNALLKRNKRLLFGNVH